MGSCTPDCQWNLTTAPAIEPFTVEEAKAQIRSVQNQEDGLINSYIKAARVEAEQYLGRGLLTQSWTLAIPSFFTYVQLPNAAPLQSVTSVKYYDVNEVQQTLSNTIYTVDTRSRPGRLTLAANQSWPALGSRRVNRVEIEYIVGWTSRDLIPESIRQGMRIYIGYLDADRDGMDANAAQALRVARSLWSDRVFWTPPSYEASY